MSQLVFGASYDMLNMGENHWIINGVSGQMRRISFLTQLPELEDLGLHKLLFPQARRKAFNFSQKSRQILEERQQRDKETVGALDGEVNKKDDLFSKLLSAKDPDTGEGLSQKQLWAESNLLIIAGTFDFSGMDRGPYTGRQKPPSYSGSPLTRTTYNRL